MPDRALRQMIDDQGRERRPLLLRVAIGVLCVLGIAAVSALTWATVWASDRDDDRQKTLLHDVADRNVRTQTLICLAHPDERQHDPVFDQLCESTINQWQVRQAQTDGG